MAGGHYLTLWKALAGALLLAANLARAADSGPRNALLTWTAPTQNTDGTAITRPLTYRIYGALQGKPKTLLATTGGLSLLLTGQPVGMMCYVLIAVDQAAESAPTTEGCKLMKLPPPTDGSLEAPSDGSIEYPEN